MGTANDILQVEQVYKDLTGKLAKFLKPRGFKRKGAWFWKESPTGELFAGILMARPRNKPKSKRLIFTLPILGGARHLHRLNPGMEDLDFAPTTSVAQYWASITENKHGKEWSLFPSTSVEAVFSDVTSRVESEALPLMDSLLTTDSLITALERERVVTGGPLLRDRYVNELKRQLSTDQHG